MIGTTLRVRYQVDSQVGETPLFSQYVARDLLLSKDVCIRVIKEPMAGEREFVDKMTDIVKEMSVLDLPTLQRLITVDSDEKAVFVVTDVPRGRPLLERVRKLAPFSAPVAVSMAIGTCEALATLHRAGKVHGDVGIHNINITSEGETQLEAAGLWQSFSLSQSAGSLMLPLMAPYMAPEVSAGGMPSASSDVYGLGVLLFEMVTGRMPYNADTPLATAMRHTTEPTPSIRQFNTGMPMVLDEIIKKAMCKEPMGRYQSGAEMLADLRILQDALRFGRTLSWPLSLGGQAANLEPQNVAPTMSAVSDEDKGRNRRGANETGDVPPWIKTTIAFLMGVATLLVVSYIVFFLNRPEEVKVPPLAGLTVAEATQQLKGRGLELRIADRRASEQIPAEQVIDSSPKEGEQVKKASEVSVIVSAGSKFVEIPDLRGLTVDKAKMLIGSVNLKLSPDVEAVRDPDVEEGMIIGTVPEWGRKVERFSTIRVRVSSGSKRSDRTTKGEKFLYTLHIKVSGTEQRVLLRVDMTDDEGTKTVHESDQEAGDTVDIQTEGYGSKVVFRIFYDNVMVKQVEKEADGDPTP